MTVKSVVYYITLWGGIHAVLEQLTLYTVVSWYDTHSYFILLQHPFNNLLLTFGDITYIGNGCMHL